MIPQIIPTNIPDNSTSFGSNNLRFNISKPIIPYARLDGGIELCTTTVGIIIATSPTFIIFKILGIALAIIGICGFLTVLFCALTTSNAADYKAEFKKYKFTGINIIGNLVVILDRFKFSINS
jgi:hypothetical protein